MTNPLFLIVDDSKTVRLKTVGLIKKLGYECLQAETGQEGLEKLRENNDIQIILTDFNMPDMNGIEMVSLIKNDKQRKHIHCVMVTSMGKEGKTLMEAAKLAGAVAWLQKPLLLEQLKLLMEKLIDSKTPKEKED